MNTKSSIVNLISWLFGIAVFTVGIINIFWGNDLPFGIFITLLSFVYFPPFETFVKQKTGLLIHPILKIILAIFIIWSTLGVGQLFAKIDLMLADL